MLSDHVEVATARALNAAIDGLTLQSLVADKPLELSDAKAVVSAIVEHHRLG